MEKKHESIAELMAAGTPFVVPAVIPPYLISCAIIGAFEGGSNYWLQSAKLVRSDFPKKKGLVWYGAEHMFDGDFEFTVEFDDPNHPDGEGNGAGKKTIDRAAVIAGLKLMAEKSPSQFGDLIDREHSHADANTYDVFMQYVILGDIVYG